MKQFLAVLAAALIVGGIYALTAGATQQGVSLSRFAKLEKKVTKLQKAVKKVQKQEKLDRNLSVAVLVYSGCNTAVTADAFQKTWTELDEASTFGSQTALNDYGLCNAFSIARQKVGSAPAVPNVSVFGALLDLLKPTSAATGPHTFGLTGRARDLAGHLRLSLR